MMLVWRGGGEHSGLLDGGVNLTGRGGQVLGLTGGGVIFIWGAGRRKIPGVRAPRPGRVLLLLQLMLLVLLVLLLLLLLPAVVSHMVLRGQLLLAEDHARHCWNIFTRRTDHLIPT